MRWAIVVLLAGCGRLGFDETPQSDGAVACGQIEERTRECEVFETGTIVEQRAFDCALGDWGPFVPTSSTCTCVDGTIETVEAACPEGFAGTITRQREYDCDTGAFGPFVDISNTCVTSTFLWVTGGIPIGTFLTPLANVAGAACAIENEVAMCSEPLAGFHMYYTACVCQ